METYRGALVIDRSEGCDWRHTVEHWLQIGVKGVIGDIPWGIGYRSKQFGLVSLDDSYVELEAHPHSPIPYVHTGFSTVL